MLVYHGSPRKISKFDFDHVGSSQGITRLGYGMYFTTSKVEAEYYADGGYLYTVELPDTKEFLDWEESIGYNLAQLVREELPNTKENVDTDELEDVLGLSESYYGDLPSMDSLYSWLSSELGSDRKASEFLFDYCEVRGSKEKSARGEGMNFVAYGGSMRIVDVEKA